MNIDIYSLGDYSGSELKNKLDSALKAQKLPHKLKEISDAAASEKAGVTVFPTVRIKDTLIAHDEKLTIDQTAQKVIDCLLNKHTHYILVPVDFTPESLHALRYAQVIAAELRMGITIAHIHEPVIDPGVVGDFDGEMMKMDCDQLEKMMSEVAWDQVQSGRYIPVNTHFDVGDVKSHIVKLVTDDLYELIIMSTQAEDTFLRRMQSSVSRTIGRHSPKPVLVVPIDAPLKFPEKVVVGLSDELFTGNALNYLTEFASDHSVTLDFVNLSNDLAAFNHLKEKLAEELNKLNKSHIPHLIHRVHIADNHLADAIKEYAANQQADLIVLATHVRKLTESVNHRSTSKQMLLKPVIPVMVLHRHQEHEPLRMNYFYEAIK